VSSTTNFTKAEALYKTAKSPAGLNRVAFGRAGLLRARAATLSATDILGLYESNLAADPSNKYVRSEYAQLLRQVGQDGKAAAVLGKNGDVASSDRSRLQSGSDMDSLTRQELRQAEIKLAQQAMLQRP
jgi:hypothetical protein